jgi:ribonucleoside-diphosphate reductase alpha chain/ribonucleoside-triphosphate reductase
MCNLTSNNAHSYVENGIFNIEKFLNAQRLSARMGLRNTCIDFEMDKWDKVQKKDRLLGCSIMGWQDMINATNMTTEQYEDVWRQAKTIVEETAKEYAEELGVPNPLLTTTFKPDGTIAQLPTVSSGVHFAHSPYYIRRVRISSDDPLVKVCEELDYPVTAENGQDWETCNTKVIAFPVKAPEGKTKYDVSALEQLEIYKSSMKHYVTHNTSITVHVREHEWEDVKKWVYDNWDDILGISFLALDDNFYPQAPYEAITEEEYNKRVSEMKPFVPSLISKYEIEEVELDIGESECSGGVCPLR